MDKAEVVRVIEYAKSLGLDPGAVLSWRLAAVDERRGHVSRPKGMLSMKDALKKYRLPAPYLSKLRREHGLPTTNRATLVLVDEQRLKEWMARYPLNVEEYESDSRHRVKRPEGAGGKGAWTRTGFSFLSLALSVFSRLPPLVLYIQHYIRWP